MSLCPICQDKEANKKNVHLIPWFLIKKCVTYEGKGHRDLELSFTISPSEFTKVFTGRSVLPENIKEYLKLTELEKENTNPYSRDYLLCHDCEDKLGRIEASFASQFTEKNIKAEYLKNNQDNNESLVCKNEHFSFTLYELFIQSIFYRCSIGNFSGLLLKTEIKDKIEENLREVFNIKGFRKIHPSDVIPLKHSFPIVSAILNETDGKDPTEFLITANKSRNPYFILAGRWAFQLFEKEKHLKKPSEFLYGISSKLNALKFYKKSLGIPNVVLIGINDSDFISNNVISHMVNLKIIGLRKTIRMLHIHFHKHSPPMKVIDFILQQYFVHLGQNNSEVDSLVFAYNDFLKAVNR